MSAGDDQLLGYIKGKVEGIEIQVIDFKKNLADHLIEEMKELKEFREQLESLRDWRTAITAKASIIGILLGFIINLVVSKIL